MAAHGKGQCFLTDVQVACVELLHPVGVHLYNCLLEGGAFFLTHKVDWGLVVELCSPLLHGFFHITQIQKNVMKTGRIYVFYKKVNYDPLIQA